MAAELIFTPEAAQDISEAYDWYEERRSGLGEEFLSRLDACLQSVLRNPEMYPVVHESYRRGLLRQFPYGVFYEYEENNATIWAVFHTARNPEKWRQRLR
jgi:plasmid stabilization system protein ParE